MNKTFLKYLFLIVILIFISVPYFFTKKKIIEGLSSSYYNQTTRKIFYIRTHSRQDLAVKVNNVDLNSEQLKINHNWNNFTLFDINKNDENFFRKIYRIKFQGNHGGYGNSSDQHGGFYIDYPGLNITDEIIRNGGPIWWWFHDTRPGRSPRGDDYRWYPRQNHEPNEYVQLLGYGDGTGTMRRHYTWIMFTSYNSYVVSIDNGINWFKVPSPFGNYRDNIRLRYKMHPWAGHLNKRITHGHHLEIHEWTPKNDNINIEIIGYNNNSYAKMTASIGLPIKVIGVWRTYPIMYIDTDSSDFTNKIYKITWNNPNNYHQHGAFFLDYEGYDPSGNIENQVRNGGPIWWFYNNNKTWKPFENSNEDEESTQMKISMTMLYKFINKSSSIVSIDNGYTWYNIPSQIGTFPQLIVLRYAIHRSHTSPHNFVIETMSDDEVDNDVATEKIRNNNRLHIKKLGCDYKTLSFNNNSRVYKFDINNDCDISGTFGQNHPSLNDSSLYSTEKECNYKKLQNELENDIKYFNDKGYIDIAETNVSEAEDKASDVSNAVYQLEVQLNYLINDISYIENHFISANEEANKALEYNRIVKLKNTNADMAYEYSQKCSLAAEAVNSNFGDAKKLHGNVVKTCNVIEAIVGKANSDIEGISNNNENVVNLLNEITNNEISNKQYYPQLIQEGKYLSDCFRLFENHESDITGSNNVTTYNSDIQTIQQIEISANDLSDNYSSTIPQLSELLTEVEVIKQYSKDTIIPYLSDKLNYSKEMKMEANRFKNKIEINVELVKDLPYESEMIAEEKARIEAENLFIFNGQRDARLRANEETLIKEKKEAEQKEEEEKIKIKQQAIDLEKERIEVDKNIEKINKELSQSSKEIYEQVQNIAYNDGNTDYLLTKGINEIYKYIDNEFENKVLELNNSKKQITFPVYESFENVNIKTMNNKYNYCLGVNLETDSRLQKDKTKKIGNTYNITESNSNEENSNFIKQYNYIPLNINNDYVYLYKDNEELKFNYDSELCCENIKNNK